MPVIYRGDYFASSVLARVERGEISVFRNYANDPYARCTAPDAPGMPDLVAPISSRDFRGWLTALGWVTRGAFPSSREIDNILQVLMIWSRKHRAACDDEAIVKQLQQSPLLVTIVEYMQGRDGDEWHGRAKDLWTTLREAAREAETLALGGRRFPGGPNVMSRQKSPQRELRRSLGIEFVIRRSNGAHLTIRCVDDSQTASSNLSSAENMPNAADSHVVDDRTIASPTTEQAELPSGHATEGDSHA